jgi:hypothetical protein
METFAIQDKVYGIFTNDTELLSLLGDPTDDESKNLRFRREELMLTELNTEVIPFLSFVFIDSLESKNYLRNKGILEVNIYCSVRYEAMGIYRRLQALLKENFDIQVIHEGQVASGIQGIYCYRVRYRIIVSS